MIKEINTAHLPFRMWLPDLEVVPGLPRCIAHCYASKEWHFRPVMMNQEDVVEVLVELNPLAVIKE